MASHADDCQPRPTRATSCHLPVQQTGTGRSLHRPSQSCDIGTANAAAKPPLYVGVSTQKLLAQRGDSKGAKWERQKHSSSSYASVVVLIVMVTLMTIAFLAGYSAATVNGRSPRILPLGISGRASKGRGDGRLLSYALSDSALSASDSRKLVSADSDSTALRVHPRGTAQDVKETLPGSNIIFITWIAFGDFGDGGFHTHNFHKVDMRWAEVARKSHPGCKIGLILDQDTYLEQPEKVDILHRLTIDKKVYGRNEYNDFYHWTARHLMLEKLQAEGQQHLNVVFLDPDIFVLDDIQEVFEFGSFDYMTTISENPEQPINGAMHFVRGHRYGAAIDVLKGVLSLFQLKPEIGFTAGQQAYSDFFELTNEEALVEQLQGTAIEQGGACNKIKGGDFNICYVICARYNFWEECTNHPAMQVIADRLEDYEAAHVKVLHFIAYRKLGMQQVYNAFMAEGLHGAYAAWAALPHTEDGYKADRRFGDRA